MIDIKPRVRVYADNGFNRFLQLSDTTETAASTPRHIAPLLLEFHKASLGDFYLNKHAFGVNSRSTPLISFTWETIRSDKVKPIANSSRFSGLANITVWEMPLYTSATAPRWRHNQLTPMPVPVLKGSLFISVTTACE